MGDAAIGCAPLSIVIRLVSQVKMNSFDDVLERFGSVVHLSETKALLVAEVQRQSVPQHVGWQARQLAVLILRKQHL
jgi:hypothetical protein